MLNTILDFHKISNQYDFSEHLLTQHIIKNCKDLYDKWKKNKIS
jgi:hypothetical protein